MCMQQVKMAAKTQAQKQEQLDMVFKTAMPVVQAFIDILTTPNAQPPRFDAIKVGPVELSYVIAPATYDTHTAVSDDLSKDLQDAVRGTIGFMLYAARVAFLCVASTHKHPLASPELPMTLENIGLTLDDKTATLKPVYLSNEAKCKQHLLKCIDRLLETRAEALTKDDQAKADWESNWKITHEKLEHIQKTIDERATLEQNYDRILLQMGCIGVKGV